MHTNPAEQRSSTATRNIPRRRQTPGQRALLKLVLLLACFSPLLAIPSLAQATQPDWEVVTKPRPVLWRVSIARVDLLSHGKILRRDDGNCADYHATSSYITRVYTVPPDARDVELACSYQYEMRPGYIAAGSGYNRIPTHAPYMQHWPITLLDETTNHQIASLWSAQPVGQVYAHTMIKYDSRGRILAKYIDYDNPKLVGCDGKDYKDCYWDVLPKHLQVVSARCLPTPDDHVLRCTLSPLKSDGWFPSPRRTSRIKVHVPSPPARPTPIGGDTIHRFTPPPPQHVAPVGSAVANTHGPSSAAIAATQRKTEKGSSIAAGSVNMHVAHPLILAKPKLVLRSARAVLAQTCDAKHPAKVDFSLTNEGGPSLCG